MTSLCKKIKLSDGSFALVDLEDFSFVNRFSWCAQREYATNGRLGLMHRFIMGYPRKGVDHINGDTRDNRKINLRICTQQQNVRNQKVRLRKLVGPVKGVFGRPRKDGISYFAYIKVGEFQYHLGTFQSVREAAEAYNEAAIKYFGQFARLNDLSKIVL